MIAKYFFEERSAVHAQALRLCLGWTMLIYFAYLTQGWTLAGEWLSRAGYHVTGTLLPSMPVAALLPEKAVGGFGVLFFFAIAYWIFGRASRMSTLLVLALIAYVTAADILTHYALNRMVIVALVLLAVAGPGRGPVWPMRILQLFLVTQYFIAGWAKAVNGDWLTNPHVLWGHLQVHYMNDLSAWMISRMSEGFWRVLQIAVVVFELSAPLLFLVKWLRPAGLILGVLLHLGIALLMQDLLFFGMVMLSFYVLFVPEETLKTLLKKIGFVSS